MSFVGSKNGSGVWQAIISEIPPITTFIELFAGKAAISNHMLLVRNTVFVDMDQNAPVFENKHKYKLYEQSTKTALLILKASAVNPEPLCINGDAISFLEEYGNIVDKNTLVYADPPYLASVRSCKKKYYKHEFYTETDHFELLMRLKALPCSIIISGYRSPLYEKELKGWRTRDIPTTNRRGKRVIETIWMNYPEPLLVHDPRFLGKNFRERERIRKKTRRWLANLNRMKRIDRISLFMSIRDLLTKNDAASCH